MAVGLEEGRIVELAGASKPGRHVDGEGAFVVPMVIDSHTHLAFRDADRRLVLAGVGGAVDLAAPLTDLRAIADLETIHAGPMLTAPGGYPTQSWGSGGYGVECASTLDVERAVDQLAAAGGRVVKLSLGHTPELPRPLLERAVLLARARGMKVVVHALSEDAASRAAALGADALAHTPLEPLSDETVVQWGERTVISTLAAFGASPAAVDNLRRLHEAGATVLYGTDLGNSRTLGVQVDEVAALLDAGLTDEEVLASMTSAPRAFWGMNAGALEVGAAAQLLLLGEDPHTDASALARGRRIWLGEGLVDVKRPQ